MNQCQDYTYTKEGKYNPNNQVISEYLQRTLVQIKTAQDEMLADHAEDCLNDVASCLQQNNSSSYYYSSSSTYEDITDTAINACKSQIKTCMGEDVSNIKNAADMKPWLETSLAAKTSPVTQITFDFGGWATGLEATSTSSPTDYLVAGYPWLIPYDVANYTGLTKTPSAYVWCWDTKKDATENCPDQTKKPVNGKCCQTRDTSHTAIFTAQVLDAIETGSKLYFSPANNSTDCSSLGGTWTDPLCIKTK